MTNQQGAPEALRPIARYKIGYHADEWGMRSSTPSGIPDPAGAWVRYEDHIAALVEAQQPATHVQKPAEIEHVAGDVSKNGTESDMAQQPAPSAAAEVKLEPVYGDVLPPVGSRVFIRHGRDNDAHACIVTGYYAWGDLKGDKRLHRVFVRMVYEGTSIEQARMLCDCYPTAGAALAAQPSPTPQADSQPVPVWDDLPTGAIINGRALAERLENGYNFECEAGPLRMCSDWQEFVRCFDYLVSWVESRAARAPADSQPPEYVGNGMFKGETIEKAAEHWANWCDVRCMTGLSEFLRVVAARAQADSVTAPAGGTGKSDPTPPAQAADSVLDDAARLDWLALAGPTSICVVIDRPHDGEVEVATDDVTGYGKTLREALDDARKQGGA